MSPSVYISALRLTAAKQALIATDRSIAEIAFDCGFSSQSYFNYKFKAEMGISPLKYRKDMLSRIEINNFCYILYVFTALSASALCFENSFTASASVKPIKRNRIISASPKNIIITDNI